MHCHETSSKSPKSISSCTLRVRISSSLSYCPATSLKTLPKYHCSVPFSFHHLCLIFFPSRDSHMFPSLRINLQRFTTSLSTAYCCQCWKTKTVLCHDSFLVQHLLPKVQLNFQSFKFTSLRFLLS